MRTNRVIGSGAILAGVLLLTGCGDQTAGPSAANATDSQTLDTAQVLSAAQAPAENTDPMPMDGGALVVADANDQSSDPMPVS